MSKEYQAAVPITLAAICFTESGLERVKELKRLAEQSDRSCGITEFRGFCRCRAVRSTHMLDDTGIADVTEDLAAWTGRMIQEGCALLFIGATGIAVRAVAPYLTDKRKDRPVLVMDDQGRFIIPLLAGHMGGANELAMMLTELFRGTVPAIPVITTATDGHDAFAVDLFAKAQGMRIKNKSGIAQISGKVLAGQKITVAYPAAEVITYDPAGTEQIPADLVIVSENRKESVLPRCSEDALILIPKEYVLGIGCKKGKSMEKIERHASACLEQAGVSWEQVRQVASVDRKADEKGILDLCRSKQIPYVTFTAEELSRVKGTFQESSFVNAQLGVGNVCERAAVLAAGEGSCLVLGKQAEDGVTAAVARIGTIQRGDAYESER